MVRKLKTPASSNKLQSIRDALNANFKERTQVIDGLLTALLCRQTLFLLGPPGTAKSELSDALCKAITGRYFSWGINKLTKEDELFGPMSIDGLRSGRYERVTNGKLPEADVAFLDEVFKGSSAILNTLLPIINERKFYNGGSPQAIPLQLVVGASNEIPQAEELGAFYDRFALRYVVERVQDDNNARALFTGAGRQAVPEITLEELEAEQNAAAALPIPADQVDALIELRRLIAQEGLFVSDRKWVQVTKIIRAYAYLQGHTQVEAEDLEILEHVLWHDPADRKKIRRLVSKVTNPLGEQITKILDAVNEVKENYGKDQLSGAEALSKLKDAIKVLQKLGNPDANQKLREAISTAQKVQKGVIEDQMGEKL